LERRDLWILSKIREILGHSDLSTTLNYLFNPLTEEETYERIKSALHQQSSHSESALRAPSSCDDCLLKADKTLWLIKKSVNSLFVKPQGSLLIWVQK
jgi:hypothetical protein